MTYTYEMPPGEPIIILTLKENFNFHTDMAKATPEAISYLEKRKEPVFWVVNILPKMDIGDLLIGTQEVSRGPGAIWLHPKIREVVLVSPHDIVHAAAPGFASEGFGNLKIQTFRSVDEALAYARSQI